MSVEVEAGHEGLVDAHEQTRLGPYLRNLRNRRSYIWYVSVSELRSRQIDTVLGNLWHLLNPALSIAIYYLIFGLVLSTDRGVDNFILFLTVGVFIFQYTQRSTTEGAKAIVSNLGLLKAIRFPRALLPITSTVTETIASVLSFVVIYAVALLSGESIRWQWVLLFVVAGAQFFFNLGAAMMAARATTHFRDTLQILPFVFRLLLYVSGVIFSVDAYASSSKQWIFELNPIYCYITVGRWCIMGGDLQMELVAIGLAWTVVVLVAGFLWFRAGEEMYARE